ncbi:MAG: DUF362 domain-containing protein [Candidatus Methanoplasma sp.]|jgi:uncharacterized Fe-S center protein|nr:DUF362 domain-containing protein [Candidatus Methanoplasma sp.]
MSNAKVYFTDMHTVPGDGLLDKLDRLTVEAGIGDIDAERKFVAIKTHFGEYGNLAFLRPNYTKVIADRIRNMGGIPFVTDCNTLYVGRRKNGVEHMDTANLNGFNPVSAGCHVIIGDGIKGTDDVEVPVDGQYVSTAKIGRNIVDADVIISLNHFKGHEITGFGGAMKNIGMGCASRRGKMELHTSGKPSIDADECRGCCKCVEACAHFAITVVEKKAAIDRARCVGCGRCIAACPFDAVSADMDEALDVVNFKIAEYVKATLCGKQHFHTSVMADISPFCDCYGHNDLPIIPNVGMLASYDPVAIDRACADLAQKQPMIAGSRLHANSGGRKPKDIFSCVHPGTRWESLFDHTARIGLGSGKYDLVEIR